MNLRITVNGAAEIARALGDQSKVDAKLRPAFAKAGVIVEGAWKDKAHKVTRKYAGSIGHEVTGQGFSLETHIGPQPGLGQPRGYSASDTSHWKKPRKGVNRGDPQVYALYEDQGTRFRPGHPAAEPALNENVDRIVDAIADGFSKVFS